MTPITKATVHACAAAFGFYPDEIMAPVRGTRALSEARFVVWYIMHNRDGMGLKAISRVWGMDHTSIGHGIRRICNILAYGHPVIGAFVASEMTRTAPTAPKHKRSYTVDPAVFAAKHKQKNERSPDDHDAMKRLRGSGLLLAALRRDFPGRCAA